MADSASYGPDSEKAFVDGLGEHAEVNRSKNHLTYSQWLRRYIAAYGTSNHGHHIVGVSYAKHLLTELEQEDK